MLAAWRPVRGRARQRRLRLLSLVDSHAHLDCDAFDADRDAVLARAADRGVAHVVVPAVSEATWRPILELATRPGPPRCHPALGVHPVALPDAPPADDARLLAALDALARATRPVAIGECGLDAVIDLTRAPFERQEQVLAAQLALARELDLPVILHARGALAYRRLAEVLAREPLPRAGGVLHSYGGGVDLLPRFIGFGLSFGFAGPATYPDARKVRASVRAVPAERLLAETDAPDQTPAPHRPARNEPAYVADIVAGIASARDDTVERIAASTTTNALRLFRIG